MDIDPTTPVARPRERPDTADPSAALDHIRESYWEDPSGALEVTGRCREAARARRDPALHGRALALEGAIALHRGELRRAFTLAAEADHHAERADDDDVRVEIAALNAQLSFFSGSYGAALQQAELAIDRAERSGDVALLIYAHRAACVVLGNLEVPDWPEQIMGLLELTIAAGTRWQEAITRNDLAYYLMVEGDLDGAEQEIERAFAVAAELAPANRFALAVLHWTAAEIRLKAARAPEALADADRAIELLTATDGPNPYVLGMTVVVKVRALLALGRIDAARRAGEGTLDHLGEHLPQARSFILTSLATALHEAGHLEEAYDALARGAELERQAFRELSELQRGLDRATLEADAARREADALAAKNRELAAAHSELAAAHSELERRTAQLEGLQEQLREQADRDWLTGLHNRRYLDREMKRLSDDRPPGPFSFAVLDLDGFKSINDRFGHDAGDRVLVRVAALLRVVLRGSDTVVRTGGEEFVFLMPSTEHAAALACCERVRRAIADEAWERTAAGLTVTASIGVASTDRDTPLDRLAKLADRRLYEAKEAGRDRVAAGGGEDEPAALA